MIAADFDRFASSLAAVLELYPHSQPLSERAKALWFRALDGHSLADVERALERHVVDTKAGQYPPKPADVVRQIDGTAEDGGELAWSKVRQAIIRVGQYRALAFDDAAIHRVIEQMGGWMRFAEAETDEMKWLGREFVSAYQRVKRGDTVAHQAVINGAPGAAQIELVGDPEKAREVIRAGQKAGALTRILPMIGQVVS